MRSREERIAAIKAQRHLEETEVASNHQKMQDACSHLTYAGYWALGITHNYPDMLPRGICMQCTLVIAPSHWECGGPKQTVIVKEHPLYPVVRWMEARDYALARLEQEYEKQIDGILYPRGYSHDHNELDLATVLHQAEFNYVLAQGSIHQDFETHTTQYKKQAVIA